MKFAKFSVCLVLLLTMFILILPVNVGAASATDKVSGDPGESVTVVLRYNSIIGINGTLMFSNPDIISSVSVSVSDMSLSYNPELYIIACFSPFLTDTEITLSIKIAEDAPIGASTKVTFEYEATSDGNFPTIPEYKYDSAVINVSEPKKIDYSALLEQIKRTEGLVADDYTSSSWDEMIGFLDIAKVAQSSTDQETVDKAAADLKRSIDSLVRVVSVDYSELLREIARAEVLVQSDYTADSWTKLQTALKAARAATSSTDQSVVDNATKNLKFAIDTLVSAGSIVDYSELQNQIRRAEALNEKDYTAESWSVMINALSEAKKATASDDQWVVDAASAALRQAIDRLVRKPEEVKIDYSLLVNYIAQAEALNSAEYTENSWSNLVYALNAAKACLESKSQDEVDRAANELIYAIRSLVRVGGNENVDYSELNRVIAEAEALNPKDYTKKSWKTVNDALYNAVQARTNHDQSIVDLATKELKAALELLVKVDYTPLIEALKKVEEFNISYGGLEDLFSQLNVLLAEAELLLDGGEQEDINRCAASIIDVLGKITSELAKNSTNNSADDSDSSEETDKDKKPSSAKDDGINIWLILFLVSLSLNVIGIIAVIVVTLIKNKKLGDDVPLVNYNIEDDAT
ncbi:MAG: FIVAR domain-containing protein [Clostridia bacterium]|nr:FIVAR domain-containing protein [Clostridia bacterium]